MLDFIVDDLASAGRRFNTMRCIVGLNGMKFMTAIFFKMRVTVCVVTLFAFASGVLGDAPTTAKLQTLSSKTLKGQILAIGK
jgi:hypothetical protein